MAAFLCTKCGACCRRAGNVPALVNLGYVGPNGWCLKLEPDNSCGIYETRPDVCRVEAGRPPMLTEYAWYRANHEACNAMMDEDGSPRELRIPEDVKEEVWPGLS